MASNTEQTPQRDILEELQTLRDRVKVKIHLGSMEVKDRWDELEPKWRELQGRMDKVGDVADAAATDIGKSAQALGKKLRVRYKELLKELDQS